MGQVQRLLTRRANEDGGRAAFFNGTAGSSVTWGGIAAHAADWPAQLCTGEDGRGRLVGLAITEPTDFCRAYLAGLANGTPLAPIDPRSTADELAERANVLALTDVIGDRLDDTQSAAFADTGTTVWTLDAGRLHAVRSTQRWVYPRPPIASSVVLATSGSTARPKLVPLDEDQLLHVATRIAGHHRLGSEDRGYCPLPLFHINAQVVGVLTALATGASLIVEERFTKDRFWEVVDEFGATWLNLVPAILATLAGSPGASAAERVRFARSASSPLPMAVQERFESTYGVGVVETYGMTEAASQITANPLAEGERRPGSVGLGVGTRIRVVGTDGGVLEAGERGEVQIDGPGVIDRYLTPGRIGSVAARQPDGWLKTGDLGHVDEDGYLYLAGRADDMINRGGEKVHPREIEEVLLRDARVLEAVAVGRPHRTLGSQPVAIIVASVPAPEQGPLAAELLRLCEVVLSRYKRPAEIFVAESLPKGRTGKINRRGLFELLELSESATSPAAQRSRSLS